MQNFWRQTSKVTNNNKKRSISTKTKINLLKWEKYETKVIRNGSSYCSHFFSSFYEIWKMKQLRPKNGQKPWFLQIFQIMCRNACFIALPSSFHQNNKIGTETISNNFCFITFLLYLYYCIIQRIILNTKSYYTTA